MRIGDVSTGSAQLQVQSAVGIKALKKAQDFDAQMALKLIESVPEMEPLRNGRIDVRV